MGIDYSAAIVVGRPHSDFDELDDGLIDDGELGAFPPYFDAPYYECLIGVSVCSTWDYTWKEFDYNQTNIDTAKEKFKRLTGLDAKVYITPVGM